jgi:predicted membrane channel-forming protein YqfA (hemolysin III family)
VSGDAFPTYSRAERLADAAVHVIGVPLGLAAAVFLMVRGLERDWFGLNRGIPESAFG